MRMLHVVYELGLRIYDVSDPLSPNLDSGGILGPLEASNKSKTRDKNLVGC